MRDQLKPLATLPFKPSARPPVMTIREPIDIPSPGLPPGHYELIVEVNDQGKSRSTIIPASSLPAAASS